MVAQETSPPRLRTSLLQHVLKVCVEEYADKGRTFSTLDSKAQNSTAIAGVFLAASLAFVHEGDLRMLVQRGGGFITYLAVAAVLALVLSILSCVFAMKVRKVVAPVDSAIVGEMAEDVLGAASSELTEETVENYLRDQVKAWRQTLHSMASANDDKATAVWTGQVLLIVAIILVSILLLLVLLSVDPSISSQGRHVNVAASLF